MITLTVPSLDCLRCGEKETLDVKKLLSSRGDLGRDGKTGLQGIWFNFHLINGDIKKVR